MYLKLIDSGSESVTLPMLESVPVLMFGEYDKQRKASDSVMYRSAICLIRTA